MCLIILKEVHLALEQIRYLVIDEADEMLNMGFIEQVEAIIKKLPRRSSDDVVFSYTTRRSQKLITKYMKEPVDIEIKATGTHDR